MSELLGRTAYRALYSDDEKWKRLQVSCQSNRLLAIYFWLLTEECGTNNRAVDLYSGALRSIIDAEKPIVTLDDLQKLKNIGPALCKVHFCTLPSPITDFLQNVAQYLWKQYPPVTDPEELSLGKEGGEDGDELEGLGRKRKGKGAKATARVEDEYRPPTGSSNYAFMILLLQALENGEKFVTKAELMARVEKSGLCDTRGYGATPAVERRRKEFDVSSARMQTYTGWHCVGTLLKQQPPYVEVFGSPRKILLTPEGIEMAEILRAEAKAAGKLKDPDEMSMRTVAQETVLCPDFGAEPHYIAATVDPAADARARHSYLPKELAVQETSAVLLPFTDATAKFDEEFDLILVIDQREQFSRATTTHAHMRRPDSLETHLETLRESDIEVSIRQLPLGDALWIARKKEPFPDGGEEYVLDWIVERKRVDDLASSIIDKRYEQQKYWLRKCGLSNILYLVEGDADHHVRGNAIRTATVATEVVDGFRVVRTMHYKETLRFYADLTHVLKKQLSSPYANGSGKDAIRMEEFTNFLLNQRRLTNLKVWGMMLTRLPGSPHTLPSNYLGGAGIGPDTAAVLSETYPSPSALYEARRTAGKDFFENEVADVRTLESGRRIGLTKSRKLCQALFP